MTGTSIQQTDLAALEHAFDGGDINAVTALLAALEANHPRAVQVQVARARVLAAQDQAPEAVKLLEQVTQQHPADPLPRAYLGAFLVGLRRFGEGLALLEEAVAHGGDVPAAHHALGVALGAHGRHEQAVVHLKAATQRSPSSAPTFFYLGASLAELGQWEQAAHAFARCCQLNAQYTLAFEALARVQVEMMQPRVANATLEEGLRHNPHAVSLLRLRVQLLADHDDLDGAIRAVDAIPPSLLTSEDMVNKAMLQMVADQWADACDDAQSAVQLDPESWRAHYTLALALEAQQPMDRDAVLRHHRKAIDLGDPLGDAGTRLGFLLLAPSHEAAPDVDGAIRVLQAAADRNGGAPGTLLNLSLAYVKAGRREDARASCEGVLKHPEATASTRQQVERLLTRLG